MIKTTNMNILIKYEMRHKSGGGVAYVTDIAGIDSTSLKVF